MPNSRTFSRSPYLALSPVRQKEPDRGYAPAGLNWSPAVAEASPPSPSIPQQGTLRQGTGFRTKNPFLVTVASDVLLRVCLFFHPQEAEGNKESFEVVGSVPQEAGCLGSTLPTALFLFLPMPHPMSAWLLPCHHRSSSSSYYSGRGISQNHLDLRLSLVLS